MHSTVDRLQRLAASRRGTVSLAGGLPADRLFPRTELANAFLRAVGQPSLGALQYGWPEGREQLRAWIAARLKSRGVSVAADDVIVTSGAQQAIAIASQLLLSTGATVEVGAESYPAALDLVRARGARTVITAERPAARYAMPAIANPRGSIHGPGGTPQTTAWRGSGH